MSNPTEQTGTLPQQLRHQDVVGALSRSVGEGVWVVDASGALQLLNQAGERLLGWAEAELLGMHMHEVVRAKGSPGMHQPLGGDPLVWVMHQERSITIHRDVFARKCRTEFLVSYTATPILTEGRVAGAVVAFRDVSDRKQPQDAQGLLAAIVESSDDAIMTKDMDDIITSWNPGAERLYGYTAAEMIGQPSLCLVPPEREDEMYRILERVQRGEQSDHFETVRLRKDGSRVEVSVSVSPLRDATGHVVGASAIARDITERNRADHEREARARQQAAMATLRQQAIASTDLSSLMDEALPIVAHTLDVEYVAVLEHLPDRTALRLRAGVGWTEGLVGQAIVGLGSQAGYALASRETAIVADLHSETRFRSSQLLQQHEVVGGVSVVMGGHERPVGVLEAHTKRRRVFTDDDLNFLRAVANLLATVSARKAAEEALRISERRYRAIFEQSPAGLILYAPNGLLLDANRAVLGALPRERTAGYNVLADQRFEADGTMKDIRRAFSGEAVRLPPMYVEPTHSPSSAEEPARWVRASLYPVNDDAGAVREMVAMVEDITEQMQAYQLLEQRVEERTHELSTLLKVSNDVASTLELQPLLVLILDQLRTVVDYTGATVFILEGEDLVPLDHRGPHALDQVPHLRIPIAEAPGYQEARRRKGPVIVDDLWEESPLAQAFLDGATARRAADFGHARSLLLVPLIVKEHVIGVVRLGHGASHFYTEQHATLAMAIANQAAVAIENARLYAQAQEMAAVEERARLARELHDSVTQMLFSASVIAEVLPRLWEREQDDAWQYLADLRLLTRGALAEMRTLLLELRPVAALAEAELCELLRQLAEAMTGRTRVPVKLKVDGERALPPDVQVTLYRMAQESLNNIAKHASARTVAISLRAGPEGVELRISDDGRGFDPASIASDHFGLRIMRERAATIGAALTVDSRLGRGTQVLVRWADTAASERS
jgi:PAS domain S-box-containing protein